VQRFEISAGATDAMTVDPPEAICSRRRRALDHAHKRSLDIEEPLVASAMVRAADEYIRFWGVDLADEQTLGRIEQQKLEAG
jgi:hypothetical protein